MNNDKADESKYIAPLFEEHKQYKDISFIRLSGIIEEAPVFSNKVVGESLYQCLLQVRRLSKISDLVPLTLPENMLEGLVISAGTSICVEGQIIV